MSSLRTLRMKTSLLPMAYRILWDWTLIIALSPFPVALPYHHAGLLLLLKLAKYPLLSDPVLAIPFACKAFLLRAPWFSLISVKSLLSSFQTTLFEIAPHPLPPFPLSCFVFLRSTYFNLIYYMSYLYIWRSQFFLPFAPWGQRVSWFVFPVPRTVSGIMWVLNKYLLNKWLKKWDAFN